MGRRGIASGTKRLNSKKKRIRRIDWYIIGYWNPFGNDNDYPITQELPRNRVDAGSEWRVVVYGQFNRNQAPLLIKGSENIEYTTTYEWDFYDYALIFNVKVRSGEGAAGATTSLLIWHDSEREQFTNIFNMKII